MRSFFGRRIGAARAFAVWGALILSVSLSSGQNLAVLSSASYRDVVSPGSAATAFAPGLAMAPAVGQVGRDGRLPRELGGVTVQFGGRAAQLAYVSQGQINFVVPRAAAEGVAEVVVRVSGAVAATGSARVARLAPGIFSANGSGAGPGALLNAATYAYAPFPAQTAEQPGCDKRTRLTVFASGIRYAGNRDRLPISTDAGAIEVVLVGPGGAALRAPVEFAGASEAFPGLDEVRIVVPEEAHAFAEMEASIVAEEIASNSVTVILTPAVLAAKDCSDFGAAFVYNTVADLLAGDLWDATSSEAVIADLKALPGDWELGGVGTTAVPARNGEVIAFGFAGAPDLVWSDPRFPPTVRGLSEEPIPFLGVAAGNPVSVVRAQAMPGAPIHQQILDLARDNGLAFAMIRVSGRFSSVSYSVAHNLLKQGTPLTDPAVDKAPFQLFFDTDRSAEWELSGFYSAGANLQEVVSVLGAPTHLHGFQLDRSRAGHIGSALVENAEIRLYPLAAPQVRDADLTLRNLVISEGRVDFEALNAGDGTVSRTTVQGLSAGRVVFQVELFDLASGEARVIAAALPAGVGMEGLEIVVDPFNEVLERDESNNAYVGF